MRTIKFKAKAANGEWAIGCLLQRQDGSVYIYDDNNDVPFSGLVCSEEETALRIPVDPKTVCQFTGILDKNGKEIYEDDVLRSDIFPFSFINEAKTCRDLRFGTIVWDEVGGKYFMLCHTNKKLSVDKYFEGVHLDINPSWCSNFEVVGNVHDLEWQEKLNLKYE